MSRLPVPLTLEHLGGRSFSFYPAILGVEPNEWLFRRATWSEIVAANSRTGEEACIPRRFVGEISPVEAPVIIVGLVRELEYNLGAVWPRRRRVIEMPLAVGEGPRRSGSRGGSPAPVVGIRLESGCEPRKGRLVGAALLAGAVTSLVIVNGYREGVRPGVTHSVTDPSWRRLTAADDYSSVVRKLGPPDEDVWRNNAGVTQRRMLRYGRLHITVILTGPTRDDARYAGTLEFGRR